MATDERKRIEKSRGSVFSCPDEPLVHRVWLPNGPGPGLAVSRAFGDYYIKDFGLISEPQITQRSIGSRDQFVILATDGVCIFTINTVTRFESMILLVGSMKFRLYMKIVLSV